MSDEARDGSTPAPGAANAAVMGEVRAAPDPPPADLAAARRDARATTVPERMSDASLAALRESEAQYRSLFESIDEGFCVIEVLFDAEGRAVDYRFLAANPAFVDQTGLQDAVGRRMRELVPEHDAHWFEIYGRVAQSGEATRFEAPAAALNRWYDVYAFRLGRPEQRRVAVLFKDVAAARAAARERERLLGELEVERARLGEVFRQAPSFIVAFRGPDQVYEFVNEAYYQLVGHRDIVGKPLLEAIPEIRDQGFKELLDRVRETGQRWVGRETPVVLARTPDAPLETRYLDMVFQPLSEADGTRSGVVVHGSDVTDHVLGRREVEAARRQAEEAQQRVAFLAEASARLAGSLDVEATLRTVAELAVPALADWCFVEVLGDDGVVRPMAVLHQDPAKVALVQEGIRRYPIDLEAPFGTGHVLRTARPELAPEITDEILVSIAQDADHLALLREIGFRSSLSVPLFDADQRAIAVLSLVTAESERRFGAADLALAEEVARRAGAALASARLYAAGQAALRRATALQRVTAALSGALSADEAAAVVVRQGVAALRARAGVVLRATDDGAWLEVAHASGYDARLLEAWRRIPADAPVPLAEAARTHQPVFVESVSEWKASYGEHGLLLLVSQTRSWAALPLVSEGRLLGVMGLSFADDGPLAAEDRALATALAQQCAQAFERARLFAAERAARAEAERANRGKSEFLAVMSHELRTPLNAIGGYAELLEMGIRGPVTAQQREDLRRIQTSQRHLLGLNNEVLNYAKLETGSVHYDLTTVRVRDALATAEALVAPQVEAKGLALAVGDVPPTLAARVDAEKLRQILVNLLSNAVKFTDRGGRIELACEARGEQVRLAVRDTGIGIPADQRERIFEPFVQVRADLTRTAEGTGLGLAISRDLARGMGGDLAVESAVGAGSTFTLTLPRA